MGHWGVRSYENDETRDALDAAFDRVHGAFYNELMDDRNPLTLEQVEAQLASAATLEAAIDVLRQTFGGDIESWDEAARLAYAGVAVRHAELGVAVPDEVRRQALAWLEGEDIEWHEATARGLRRQKEIALLRK